MLRAIAWTLRQPRYRAIAVFMTLLAVAFAGIGTFEVHRFNEKRHDNDVLRANARSAAVALSSEVVPLTGSPAPATSAVKYRHVTATGTYLGGDEQYLDDQRQGGRNGFLVVTPLRTSAGVLLVARGFVAATASGERPASVAAPPGGTVRVRGLLYPGQGRGSTVGADEITAVDPGQQATRLGTPVFQAYLGLAADQPGTAGLRPVPRPDLSNPSGGAGSLQLLSYVLQWYVFALLALCAPFLLARNEVRDARRRFLGLDPDDEQFDAPAVEAGPGPEPIDDDRALIPRARGEVARLAAATERRERAERLADRYGRSLGPATVSSDELVAADRARARRPAFVAPFQRTGDEATAGPYRSSDDYHGAYNDHLWQLALADGDLPELVDPAPPEPRRSGGEAGPRIIDVDPADTDANKPTGGDR